MKTSTTLKKLLLLNVVLYFIVTSLAAQEILTLQSTQAITLRADHDSYIIDFHLPAYGLEDDFSWNDAGWGPFTQVVLDGEHDATDVQSYPQLPFYSLNLSIPYDSEIDTIFFYPSNYNVHRPNYMLQPSIGEETLIDFETYSVYPGLDRICFNENYYRFGYTDAYPSGFYNSYYEVSPIYTGGGERGFTLSIFPFSYEPTYNRLNVLTDGVLIVKLKQSSSLIEHISAIENDTTQSAFLSRLYYDSFTTLTSYPRNAPNFMLIVSSHDLERQLQDFVQYKTMVYGMNMRVIFLDAIDGALGNPEKIYHIINSGQYGPSPDFVLLIGTLEAIPPYEGDGRYFSPHSDDGYHSMLGRWILSDDYKNGKEELYRIVRKTIDTELGLAKQEATVALLSGTDSKLAMRNWFYHDVEKLAKYDFQPIMPHKIILVDGRDSRVNQTALKDVLDNYQPQLFIYSGHGSINGIADPYNWSANRISEIETHSPYPMGFGFACLLNAYTTNSGFASRWVANSVGGVSYYASTTTTSLSPDRMLARKIFSQYKEICQANLNCPLSVWLRTAETKYYNAMRGSIRRRQIQRYNLIGDPSLLIKGINVISAINPNDTGNTMRVKCMNNEHLENENDICTTIVSNIQGQQEVWNSYVPLTELVQNRLDKGVYIVKYMRTNGEEIVRKIIK